MLIEQLARCPAIASLIASMDIPVGLLRAYKIDAAGHKPDAGSDLEAQPFPGAKQHRILRCLNNRAMKRHPDLAQEIARRGHEIAAHGRTWQNSYFLPREEEKRFIAESVEMIDKVTGQRHVGWNAYWLRNSVHILETLQDLGFLYQIDEPSHDEPFIIPVRGKDFVTVPCTLHMNDISSFPFEGFNPMAYEQALKDEFDQLYEEGATRRRMMLIGFHDRINGHANRIRMLDRFLTYAQGHDRVWFARKDEIAKWVLKHRDDTPILHRGDPDQTGLPGRGATYGISFFKSKFACGRW